MNNGGTALKKALRKGATLRDDGKLVWGLNAAGQPVCSALTDHGPCQSPFTMPNGRCKMHFGNMKRGVDSENFKHGTYSSVLKGDLAANYRNILKDNNFLSTRDNIALLGARITQLLSNLDIQNDAGHWTTISSLHASIRRAIADGKLSDAELLLDRADQVVAGAIDNDKIWESVNETAELQRRQVETEQKLANLKFKVLSQEEMYTILARLKHEINTHVTDPQTRSALSQAFRALVSGDTGGSYSAGGSGDNTQRDIALRQI